MKDVKTVCEVYETTNYDLFERLMGNRTDVMARASKIEKSISAIGLRNNPIIINEKFEVIDGQGRLEASKKLGLPVRFIIDSNADIEVCKWMNIGQTNWRLMDYVQCYAENGNQNYTRLLALMSRHPQTVSVQEILAIKSNVIITGGGWSNDVKTGDLIFTESDFNSVDATLNEIETLMPYILKIEGSARITKTAIAFCLRTEGVDKQRLMKIVKEKYVLFVPSAGIIPTLTCISDLYNKGLKNNRMHFETIYKDQH